MVQDRAARDRAAEGRETAPPMAMAMRTLGPMVRPAREHAGGDAQTIARRRANPRAGVSAIGRGDARRDPLRQDHGSARARFIEPGESKQTAAQARRAAGCEPPRAESAASGPPIRPQCGRRRLGDELARGPRTRIGLPAARNRFAIAIMCPTCVLLPVIPMMPASLAQSTGN
ncbi:hypothetical protein [Pendulispora albinea]|uniref:Uncharacterized protein n=1 Tax=Pendulispora albinea TaxID=2741071 RepID=A0ABZ2MAN5_9BACT